MIRGLFTKESKTIAGAALIIGVTTILSRVLGLIRDRLLVSHFTVGDSLDAYYASFQIPNMIFALLVLGTLSVAFIPVFSEYLTKGKRDEAWHIANSILTVTAAGMGVVCLVLVAAAPLVVRWTAPGFTGEKLALTIKLTRIMMLSPFFFAVSAVFSSILNSCKQFLAVSLAPLLYNGSIILGVLFLTKPFGIVGVAYGAIGGAILHILVQLPGVISLGMRYRPSFDVRHPGVREIGKLFLPRVFGVDISQIAQFIGTIVGTTLGAGAVSLFTLSINIEAVPVGVFAIPFAIAAFPSMTEAFAKADRREFVRVFATTFRQIVFFLAPLTAMTVLLRIHILRALIGSRGLTADDTRLAGASLALFALSLAFQGLTPLLSRSFYAIKNTYIPVIVSGIAVAANVAATFALIPALRQGLLASAFRQALALSPGADLRMLALPTAFSISSLIQVALLFVILRRKFGPLGGRGIMVSLLKFLVGSVLAALVTWGYIAATGGASCGGTFVTTLVQAFVASILGLGAYALTLRALKSEELDSVIMAVKQRLLRFNRKTSVIDAERL
jgi:putative peptidoglycan lipid II flippase